MKVEDTPAVLLKGMAGSVLPIAVAHGEGRAEFASREAAEACLKTGLVTLRPAMWMGTTNDYSGVKKPPFRNGGNRQTGTLETALAA